MSNAYFNLGKMVILIYFQYVFISCFISLLVLFNFVMIFIQNCINYSEYSCNLTENWFPLLLQLEIDSGSELTEEFLQDELHPKRNLHRPKFEKPKGPPNRGAKRLTKLQQ
ncbi:hypothetical protein J6590_028907 [Homalodisca vitripennis]|nr:hypothetical protein J6590_028907 [Homalodisca vitripennis]